MSAFISVAAMLLSNTVSGSVSLQPEGKWKLDAGATICVLQHEFSGNGEPWSLAFLPQPGFTRMELLLARHGPQNRRAGEKASLTIRPSGAMFQGDVQTSARPDGVVSYRISVDNSLLGALSQATDVEIAVDHSPAISLSLSGAAAALAALRTCEQDLVASWGVDPSRLRPFSPSLKASGFPTSADIPPVASGASGRVILLLEIGSTGKVANCKLIESSGNPVLDQRTCNIALSRMHIAPLLDADGKPIVSWTMFSFRWTAPPDPF